MKGSYGTPMILKKVPRKPRRAQKVYGMPRTKGPLLVKKINTSTGEILEESLISASEAEDKAKAILRQTQVGFQGRFGQS
jgi:hypothetical protein